MAFVICLLYGTRVGASCVGSSDVVRTAKSKQQTAEEGRARLQHSSQIEMGEDSLYDDSGSLRELIIPPALGSRGMRDGYQ